MHTKKKNNKIIKEDPDSKEEDLIIIINKVVDKEDLAEEDNLEAKAEDVIQDSKDKAINSDNNNVINKKMKLKKIVILKYPIFEIANFYNIKIFFFFEQLNPIFLMF